VTVITVNQGEYGLACVFNTSFNLSAFTVLQIQFTKPDGTVLTKSATAPNVNISTALGTFLANQYAQYTFQNGDINITGVWQARVLYTDATPMHLISNISTFTVTP
jgi:hypothetical protein